MEPKKTYKHAGSTFELFKAGRLKDAKSGKQRWKVIYTAVEDNLLPNIEVLILNETEPNPIFNPNGENTLSYPKSEYWGRLGWTFRNLAAAENKYNLIKDEEE